MINKKNLLLMLSLCTTHYATAAHSFSSEFPSLRTVCIGGIAVATTGALAYNYFFKKPLSGVELEQANEKALNTIYNKINEYATPPNDYTLLEAFYGDGFDTFPNEHSVDIYYNNTLMMNVKASNLKNKPLFFTEITNLTKNEMEESVFISIIKETFTPATVITVTFPR